MTSLNHGRAEVLAAVPHMFGVAPCDCVVILTASDHGLRSATRHHLGEDITATARAAARYGLTSAVLIGYSASLGLIDALTAAHRQLTDHDITVADVLVVVNQRWTALDDSTERIRPVPGTSAYADRLIRDGYTLTDHDPARHLAPVASDQREAVNVHLDALAASNDDDAVVDRAHALCAAATVNAYPDNTDVAVLIAASWLADGTATALAAMHGTATPRAHLDLWTWVARHAAGIDIAGPASLASAAARRCRADTLARAWARIAMAAALGWGPALVANLMLNDDTTRTQRCDQP